jgi:phytoene dehydrogenase-like protein
VTRPASHDADVIIVGAGLAGLACAIHLTRAGREVLIVEASDGVGGRVRSDVVDGFILDRGFQVLLTAYPEAKAMLNYDALDLRAFRPGALVQHNGARSLLGDPFRDPKSILSSVRAPVGTLVDKARVGFARLTAGWGPMADLWKRPETSTAERIRALGVSTAMTEQFFQPLFAGIQLDPSLSTSSRMFDFVFRMLADGDNAIPAQGIGTISTQLASRIPAGAIRLRTRVASVGPGVVTLTEAATLRAGAVVVATDGPQAAKLLGGRFPEPGSNAVACLYFAADEAPIDSPVLVLNGDGPSAGPVNNLCVPSLLSRAYAPAGSHLISASVIAARPNGVDRETWARSLDESARVQLRGWFGSQVDGWATLPMAEIPHAQPAQRSLEPFERSVDMGEGLFVCGDHRDQASINGALTSGRRAAAAVLAATAFAAAS